MTARRPDEWLVGVPCMECGAQDFEITRLGWAEGLGDWLRFGGPWRPTRRVCRRCGNASDSRSVAMLVPSPEGWWSVPVRLLQTLRQHRTMIPVPATYLAVTVAGVALGVAAQLLLGWRWWLVAAGVVAAVWLFFASTALWGAGGSSQPLTTDLLRVVRPRRAIERDHQREVERFRAAPFPLYGLPAAWMGWRHLGGWEGGWAKGRRPVTTALSLAHGDPLAEEGPQLRVEVRAERVEPELGMTVRVRSRRHLAENLWLAAAPPARDPAGHVEQLAAACRRPDPAWSSVTILVDGRPVGFEWLGKAATGSPGPSWMITP